MTFVYVDVDDFKRSLSLDGTTFIDEDAEIACAAASEGIDDAMGRTFGLGEDDEEVRLYPSDGSSVVYIDDLAELTSIRVNRTGDATFDTWTVDTDFRLEPVNAPTLGKSWTSLRVLRTQTFPNDEYAVVEITGKFGWASPPQRIIMAAGIIAAKLIKRKREAPFGFVMTAENAAYIARNDPDLGFLFEGLARRKLFV